MNKIPVHRLLLALFFILSGCQSKPVQKETAEATLQPTITFLSQSTVSAIDVETPFTFAGTQNNLSGNHSIDGSIDLAGADTIDIPLSGEPQWLVGVPFQNSVVFAAALVDGSVFAYQVTGQEVQQVDLNPHILPSGMPPALVASDEEVQLLIPPEDASLLTNPILVDKMMVYIAANGDLVFQQNNEIIRLTIDALPDARILVDEDQRLLLLTHPVTRYDHGVLGDTVEAAAITWVQTQPEIRELYTIPINAPDVIEGISPIWADMDNDGVREVIVTLSNPDSGSRIAVFTDTGSLLAESSPIGSGYRWRHQLAAAPFSDSVFPLLAVVRTPHIGGVVEFFTLENAQLESVAEISGYRSHNIGSRNLDSAVAADYNGDGIHELLVPNQAQTHLCVLSPAGEDSCLPLNGNLSTNLSAVNANGNLYIAAGTPDHIRVWLP